MSSEDIDKTIEDQNPMKGHNDQPAPWSAAKRIVRRKLKKREEHPHEGLNIYPMMDMMTILLVFLVMQFALSTAAIVTESEELLIPFSTSDKDMQDGVIIQIARSSITVKGESVLELQNGRIDAGDKQGGSTSMIVNPLLRKMKEIRRTQERIASAVGEQGEALGFTGEVMIVAHEKTPYRTLSEVIATLGSAGFGELRFLTDKVPPK